jgi:hypothetical protein
MQRKLLENPDTDRRGMIFLSINKRPCWLGEIWSQKGCQWNVPVSCLTPSTQAQSLNPPLICYFTPSPWSAMSIINSTLRRKGGTGQEKAACVRPFDQRAEMTLDNGCPSVSHSQGHTHTHTHSHTRTHTSKQARTHAHTHTQPQITSHAQPFTVMYLRLCASAFMLNHALSSDCECACKCARACVLLPTCGRYVRVVQTIMTRRCTRKLWYDR